MISSSSITKSCACAKSIVTVSTCRYPTLCGCTSTFHMAHIVRHRVLRVSIPLQLHSNVRQMDTPTGLVGSLVYTALCSITLTSPCWCILHRCFATVTPPIWSYLVFSGARSLLHAFEAFVLEFLVPRGAAGTFIFIVGGGVIDSIDSIDSTCAFDTCAVVPGHFVEFD